MNAIEILSELESVDFTTDQARTITRIFEKRNIDVASKEDVHRVIDEFKGLKDGFKGLEGEFKELKGDFKGLEGEFKELKDDFKGLEVTTKDEVQRLEAMIKKLEATTKDEIKKLDFATKDGVRAEILSSKYDLVKWIAGGLIANGLLNLLLKYYG